MARTKPTTHRYYRESNTSLNECGVLTRPALLMIEGVVTDSTGQKTTYTRDLIDAIVEASNTYGQSNEIKLFNDHEYSQESRIGAVTGLFSAREINDLDIPENGDRSIVGKYAIFNDGLEIRSEDAIEQYHSGLLKELSIGLDLKGSFFGKNVIYEVSAVPFPAVDSAHLYSINMDEDTLKYAYTFDAAMRRFDTPKTEADYQAMDDTQKGFSAFKRCIDNIKNATDSELPKTRYKCVKNAVNALSEHLMGIHAPKPDEDITDNSVPITMMEKPMPEETTTYSAADVQALQSQLAKLQKDNQDTRKFSALKDRAAELNRSGKLSAAKYKALFEGDKAFENYQASLLGDPLEETLNYIDAHITPDVRLAPSIYGATPLADQAVPERPESDAEAIKKRAASIPVPSVSY